MNDATTDTPFAIPTIGRALDHPNPTRRLRDALTNACSWMAQRITWYRRATMDARELGTLSNHLLLDLGLNRDQLRHCHPPHVDVETAVFLQRFNHRAA